MMSAPAACQRTTAHDYRRDDVELHAVAQKGCGALQSRGHEHCRDTGAETGDDVGQASGLSVLIPESLAL